MRNFLIVLALLYGGYYYVSRHYEFHDTLVYAQKHKEAKWSAPVEYYVGVVYYERSDYPKAQEAFSQLLTDHPTDYDLSRALVMLGDSAEYNRDWQAASDALNKYLQDYPNGHDTELVRGRIDMLRYRHGNEITN